MPSLVPPHGKEGKTVLREGEECEGGKNILKAGKGVKKDKIKIIGD